MNKELTPKQNGGKREGSGRKPGSANKLTRSLANELCRQGCDGLSNMVENMLFWRDKARELGELLQEKLKSDDPEIQKEAMTIARSFLAARENNHRCAVDVAPYTNPRLQSIEFRGQVDLSLQKVEDASDVQSAAEAYQSTLRLVPKVA